MIGELIIRCFHARTNAHVCHLQTLSLSKHLALQAFYEGIIDIVDRIAEGYQGEHEMIDFTTPVRFALDADPVKLVSTLKEWVEKNRYDAVEAEDTFIHNEIDTLVLLCAATLYKLRKLK